MVINGPGFNPGQIEELEDQLKKSEVGGIHIVDLYEYDWNVIDQEWKADGNPISIKQYYKDMYHTKDEERIYFGIEVDNFQVSGSCSFRTIYKTKRRNIHRL